MKREKRSSRRLSVESSTDRRPSQNCDQVNQKNTEDKNIWSIELGKSVELIVEHQQNAADLSLLRNWIENGKRPQRKNMALYINFLNEKRKNS